MEVKRLILLNGSPRKIGTSYSFSRTISKLAEDKSIFTELVHIIEYFDGTKDFDDLKDLLSQSDIIGFIQPLYVDALPYPVIWCFEKLFNESKNVLQGKNCFAIGQSGFPDITLCDPLLGSCKLFATATGMNWLGGLAYGGGAIIDGRLLENLGGKGRKITKALNLSLESILLGKEIPIEAQTLLTIKIPKLLYLPMALILNQRSRSAAKKLGVVDLERKYYLG
jgi:hypothetical protein